jgi:hypothetical protein
VFWAGLLWGLVVPLSGRRFPIFATSIFLWSSAILLDYRGLLGCYGDDLSVVSIPVFSSTLGSMAYSRATLGIAAGLWLLLSANLGVFFPGDPSDYQTHYTNRILIYNRRNILFFTMLYFVA